MTLHGRNAACTRSGIHADVAPAPTMRTPRLNRKTTHQRDTRPVRLPLAVLVQVYVFRCRWCAIRRVAVRACCASEPLRSRCRLHLLRASAARRAWAVYRATYDSGSDTTTHRTPHAAGFMYRYDFHLKRMGHTFAWYGGTSNATASLACCA